MSGTGFALPRGMKDIEPGEMAKRLWVQDTIRRVLSLYGFRMMEPTTIEYLETLEAKSGPDIRKEIYWFADKAGRNLGLRFDLTVGMTRMVATRPDLPEPVKLAAIAGMWRYDEPQYARYRHFYQWDAEIYGSSLPEADAEAISAGIDILEALRLSDYEVRISNRRLTEKYLNKIGISSEEQVEKTIRVIDKIRKLDKPLLIKEFEQNRLTPESADQVLEFALIHGEPNKVLSKIAERGMSETQGYQELSDLADILKSLGKDGVCSYDMSIVRGIGYYDGIVFEAYDKGGEDIGAVFGGGRYDGLCKIYGRDIPATGVAGGIERLILSLERADLFKDTFRAADVFVAAATDAVRAKSREIVRRLRAHGISSELDLKQRPLGKQLEYADSLGARFAVILGPKELEQGKLRIKDLTRREEKEIILDLLIDELTKGLKSTG